MSIPLFFPPVQYVKSLSFRGEHKHSHMMTLEALCHLAEVTCRGSGLWTQRQIDIAIGENIELIAEPGDWGNVRVKIPDLGKNISKKDAQLALSALAYGLHDLVAKQSLSGYRWSHLQPPPGRPKSPKALSNKERQRRFRERMKSRL